MNLEKIVIKNRNNLKITLRLTIPQNVLGLAFVEHGFSGAKEEKHILLLEQKLAQKGYIVVNFDATNSINESESSKEGITFSSHYSDLEDVISWAKNQSWYKEPFLLSGHSMGASSVVLYAQNYPNKVETLLPLSLPWIKGESYIKQNTKEFIDDFVSKGYIIKEVSRSDKKLYVPYSFLQDLLKYDFISNAKDIKARTILIIGDAEKKLRLDENKVFFDSLTCKKELIILPNVPHSLAKDPNHEQLFAKTLDSVL